MQRIVLVGCGFMGKMHASVYRMLDDAELVGVVDRNQERAKGMADEFGVPSFADLEGAVLSSECSAVDICLPTYLHREYTEEAAGLGKHVFCEKPMALTTADANAMLAATQANNVRLMIGHCIRFWPEYSILKDLVENGSLGRLLSLNLTRYGEFPTWSSDNWLADESRSGGGALDMHIHDTDFALYLLGRPDVVESFGTEDVRGVSQIFTTMQFGDAIVHLEGGWNLPPRTPFKMAFRAIFERGAAIMDGGPLLVYSEGQEPLEPDIPKLEVSGGGNISDLGGYLYELKYFVERLESREPFDQCTPESSRDSLAVTLDEIAQSKSRTSR